MKNESKFIKLLNLILLGFLCSACLLTEKKTNAKKVSTFFTQGNPQNLIAKTQLNPQSFLSLQNLASFQNFQLASVNIFTQQKSNNQFTQKLSSMQHPVSAYEFSLQNDGSYLYSNPFNSRLSFVFSLQQGLLYLDQIILDGKIYYPQIYHYSLKNNHQGFSILLGHQDQSQKALIALYFVQVLAQNQSSGESGYHNLFSGKKVRWKNSFLNLSVCGSSQLIHDQTKYAASLWNQALMGNFKLNILSSDHCPPFSDLNVQGVYLVEDYLTLSDQTKLNPATTLPVAQVRSETMLDSDIFIWKSELQKNYPTFSGNQLRQSLGETILHEIGHVLGLGHADSDVGSIMSYDSNRAFELYPHDINHLQTLY